MSKPLMPFQINKNGTYWAAWGNTGWSAVHVLALKPKWVTVERVNPKTGAITTRKSKVKRAELVKRDPDLDGSDRPELPPSTVFAQHRTLEAEQAEEHDIDDTPPPMETPKVEPAKDGLTDEKIAEIIGMLADKSTTADW